MNAFLKLVTDCAGTQLAAYMFGWGQTVKSPPPLFEFARREIGQTPDLRLHCGSLLINGHG